MFELVRAYAPFSLTNGLDALTCHLMDTFAQPKPVRLSLPGYRHLLLFFIPLALSSSMMTLEPLIINTALSHGSNS